MIIYMALFGTHIVGIVYITLGFQLLQLHIDGANKRIGSKESSETTYGQFTT